MIEAGALVFGFAGIAGSLIGMAWTTEYSKAWKVSMTVATTIWCFTSSISVLNGVAV